MRSRRVVAGKQGVVSALRGWFKHLLRGRARAAWISATCAVIAFTGFCGPTAASASPGPQTVAPATAPPAWSGYPIGPAPRNTHGAHPNAFVNQYCAGYFATPLVEKDSYGRYYLHFGGYQQCAPSPMEQSVEFDLYKSNGTYVSEAYSGYHVAYMLPAYKEPFCANRVNTTYYMEGFGYAGGSNLYPYPATSARYTLACGL